MAAGLQVWDASGNIILDTSDYTFRFVSSHTFTISGSSDVIVSVSGIAAGTHFATTVKGFPVVETNQVRIKPQFNASGTDTLFVFRI